MPNFVQVECKESELSLLRHRQNYPNLFEHFQDAAYLSVCAKIVQAMDRTK
jgi:hypothetical protein